MLCGLTEKIDVKCLIHYFAQGYHSVYTILINISIVILWHSGKRLWSQLGLADSVTLGNFFFFFFTTLKSSLSIGKMRIIYFDFIYKGVYQKMYKYCIYIHKLMEYLSLATFYSELLLYFRKLNTTFPLPFSLLPSIHVSNRDLKQLKEGWLQQLV